MNQLSEKEAKLLVGTGVIRRAVITNAPLEPGYILLLFKSADRKNQNHNFDYSIKRQRGGERVFKTLDAAASFIFTELGLGGFEFQGSAQ